MSAKVDHAAERALAEEAIGRSQRILRLVDAYAEMQTTANRTALRTALFNEFRAAALRDLSDPAPVGPY